MSNLRTVTILLLLSATLLAAQPPGEGEALVAASDQPWLEEPDHILAHQQRLELLRALRSGELSLEDAADALAEAVADPFEDPELRRWAADALAGLTVEIEVEGETVEQPRALAAALTAAVVEAEDLGWVRSYLRPACLERVGLACGLLALMTDPAAVPLHQELARDFSLGEDVRLTAVGSIGSAEGRHAYRVLTELAADPTLPDALRVAAMTTLAPIGYDEGRAFLEEQLAAADSPALRTGAAAALELLDQTAVMTPGAWIMLALGFLLLFGGAVLFIIIATRRATPHVFSDEGDEEDGGAA